MHVYHEIPCRAPSSPIKLTLDLLPTHVCVVHLHARIAVRCGLDRTHLVPIDKIITVSSKSPNALIDAAEDMIRYLPDGRAAMADMLIGIALTEWHDPCLAPQPEDHDEQPIP